MHTNKYITYPSSSEYERFAEGGLRLRNDEKKQRDPNKLLTTIITVVLNRKDTIRQCMDSIIHQTHGIDNIEYIIIDGGSTDGTLDVIEEYDARGFIDYYLSEKDRGLYHAMDKGLELAGGEVVAFLNSDDWYDLDAVEVSVQPIASGKADYTFADCYMVAPPRDELSYVIEANPILFEHGIPYPHPTLFCRRKCYDEVGLLDERLSVSADYDFMIRLMKQGYPYKQLSRRTATARMGGVSTNPEFIDRMLRDRSWIHETHMKFIREQFIRDLSDTFQDLLEIIRKIRKKKIVFFGTGGAGRIIARHFPLDIDYFVDNDPDKWGTEFRGHPVFPPDQLSRERKSDLAIIVSSMYYREIKYQLTSMKLKEGRHFWDGKKIFYFLFKLRARERKMSDKDMPNLRKEWQCESL